MTPQPLLRGELQEQIMAVLWREGEGTVEDVREALPERSRSGYKTVQTVLNRLAQRGLLTRTKAGHSLVYRPTLGEAEYFAGVVASALEAASPGARQTVLAQLSSSPAERENSELRKLDAEISG